MTKLSSGKLPRNVILHAGMSKAGSTAIQNFFDRSYDSLLRQGILFPRSVLSRKDPHDKSRTSGHYELVRLLRKNNVGVFIEECERHWKDVHTLVLSAEHLFANVDTDDLRKLRALLADCNITLLVLLRPQHSWISSRYYESVVKGYMRESRTIDQFVNDAIKSGVLDYAERIEMLSGVLSPIRVEVLNYSDLAKQRRLLARICEIVGFESGEVASADPVPVNSSEPFPEAIEAHRQLNDLACALEKPVYRAWCGDMRQHYQKLARQGRLERGDVLPSLPVRKKLSDAMAEPNQRLSDRYLNGTPFELGREWLTAPETRFDTGLVDEIYCFGGELILERLQAKLRVRRVATGT